MQAIDVSPDYSAPPSQNETLCLLNHDYRLAIVGGEAPRPPDMQRYLTAYRQGGLDIGAYGFVRHRAGDHLWSIRNALAGSAGQPIKYFGVDAELPALGVPYGTVKWQIADAVTYARNHVPAGCEVILYTGPWWWNDVMHGDTETFGCRGWLAAYYAQPKHIEFVPPKADASRAYCGGWNATNTLLWQYQSSPPRTCNIHADRNLVLIEPTLEEDMAITMAACGDSPSGYRVYALGGGTPRWILNAPEADELIRLFGQPKPISFKALQALGA